jgi:hypothetical protein
MNKRSSEEEESQRSKIPKKNDVNQEAEISNLPNILLKHLCQTYLDFKSLLRFSSTNKNNQNLFSEFRKSSVYLHKSGFVKEWNLP